MIQVIKETATGVEVYDVLSTETDETGLTTIKVGESKSMTI